MKAATHAAMVSPRPCANHRMNGITEGLAWILAGLLIGCFSKGFLLGEHIATSFGCDPLLPSSREPGFGLLQCVPLTGFSFRFNDIMMFMSCTCPSIGRMNHDDNC